MAAIFCAGLANAAAPSEATVAMSLDEFTRRVLENSLRSRTIQESLDSQRYGYLAGKRSLTWPTLNATASRGYEGSDSDTGIETEGETTSGALALDQPFLTGGTIGIRSEWTNTEDETITNGIATPVSHTRTRPAVSASIVQPLFLLNGNNAWRSWKENRINWNINQTQNRTDFLTLQFDARSLYYQLLFQIESVAVERKKSDSSKIVERTTRTLVRAGKLPEVEQIRADIRSNRDDRRIQNSQQSLEKSLNEAKDFLQISPSWSIRFTSPLVYEPFKTPLNILTKEALDNSPAVQRARLRVTTSGLDVARRREGNRPAFSSYFTYALTKDRSDPLAPVDPTSWTAGVTMSWSVFDATLTRLRLRQAELSHSAVRRDLESIERETRVSVENTYIDLKRTEDQIRSFDLQRKSADQNLRAMQLRYQNGLTRLSDVFDAENEVRDLELEYLGLLVDYNVSRDRLLVLVGRNLFDSRRKVQ